MPETKEQTKTSTGVKKPTVGAKTASAKTANQETSNVKKTVAKKTTVGETVEKKPAVKKETAAKALKEQDLIAKIKEEPKVEERVSKLEEPEGKCEVILEINKVGFPIISLICGILGCLIGIWLIVSSGLNAYMLIVGAIVILVGAMSFLEVFRYTGQPFIVARLYDDQLVLFPGSFNERKINFCDIIFIDAREPGFEDYQFADNKHRRGHMVVGLGNGDRCELRNVLNPCVNRLNIIRHIDEYKLR